MLTRALDASATGSSHPAPPARTPSRGSPSLHTSPSTAPSRGPSAPSPPQKQTPDRTPPPPAPHQHPALVLKPLLPLSPSTMLAPPTRGANVRSPFLRLRQCRTDHPSVASRDT